MRNFIKNVCGLLAWALALCGFCLTVMQRHIPFHYVHPLILIGGCFFISIVFGFMYYVLDAITQYFGDNNFIDMPRMPRPPKRTPKNDDWNPYII